MKLHDVRTYRSAEPSAREEQLAWMLDEMQTRAELYATIRLHDNEVLDASIAQTVLPS